MQQVEHVIAFFQHSARRWPKSSYMRGSYAGRARAYLAIAGGAR